VRIDVGTFAFHPGEETCIRYTATYTEERKVITMIFVSGTDERKFMFK
jgi:hypothetical protein